MPAEYEALVKKLKKQKRKGKKKVDNPFALAHYIMNKQEGKARG